MDGDSRKGEDGYPRAPSHEEWEAMTPEERLRVVHHLPGEVTYEEMAMPEGHLHSDAKIEAYQRLGDYFQRQGRSVYVVSELPVYYPDTKRFAPDVLVVLDVPTHKRDKWLVDHEGKGLDWVLEVHVGGDRRKDALHNVKRYAELKIPEYFIFNPKRETLEGYRLKPCAPHAPGVYERMKAPRGQYTSQVLGLKLRVVDGALRFKDADGAWLLGPAERAQEEARARKRAEQRATREAQRRAEAERRLAELQAELEGFHRGPKPRRPRSH